MSSTPAIGRGFSLLAATAGALAAPRRYHIMQDSTAGAGLGARKAPAAKPATRSEDRGGIPADSLQIRSRVPASSPIAPKDAPSAGDVAAAALAKVYPDTWNDRTMRLEVVAALGATESPEAVKTLGKAWSDLWTDRAGRAAVLGALGATHSAEGAQAIAKAYAGTGNDRELRLAAIKALGQSRTPEAVPALERAYSDTRNDRQASLAVIQALGETQAADAVTLLMRAYADSWNDPERRAAVVRALGNAHKPVFLQP